MADQEPRVRLLGAGDVRELAGRLGVRPAKRLGQNFVVEPGTVRRIASLAALRPDDVVLEVGPGLGSLTLALLEAGPAGVIAVEIDPVLANELPQTIASRAHGLAGRVTVLNADALRLAETSPGELAGGPPTTLVANLPYNVAVPVLLHLLAALSSLQRGLVMVQAEVADRMCAGPGSRVYGAPSVKLAWFAAARPAGPVPRTVFWPMPNVDSRLVAFTRHDPPATTASRAEVFAVIDAAFRQRRKTLRAALSGWAGSAPEAERLLRAADIDPGARGESLGVGEFARLAAAQRRLKAPETSEEPSEPEGAASPGLRSEGRATREGDASRRPEASEEPSEPEGAASPGLRSEGRATREGDASRRPEASEEQSGPRTL
jgi:16S rRNA (adenine1518-N6/adenine1519-N6)-dimethyltransferase